MITDLRVVRAALGGEISGAQLLAAGPGHSPRDRSLSIRLSPYDPDGFIVYSHSGDDWKTCKAYVLKRLGLPIDRPQPRQEHKPKPRPQPIAQDPATHTADALKIWREGVDPRKTLAEIYLAGRGLDLGEDIAGEVLRWHPRTRALLGLFRHVQTDEPRAVSRTFIDDAGLKIGRKFLGPVGGGAIKLDANEEVTQGLHIGEGIETCLAARQIGLKPTWALGSAGAIAVFPVLAGIEALSLLREHDEANRRAADECTRRWIDAGRSVYDVWPQIGKDVNDSLRAQR